MTWGIGFFDHQSYENWEGVWIPRESPHPQLGGGNSNIFYVHPYLGKIPILTNIFQMGWNHQPVNVTMIWFRNCLKHFSNNLVHPNPAKKHSSLWDCYLKVEISCQIPHNASGYSPTTDCLRVVLHNFRSWETYQIPKIDPSGGTGPMFAQIKVSKKNS